NARGFRDKGNTARAARIRFEHKDLVVFDRELQVEEAENPEAVRQAAAELFDLVASFLFQTLGRNHAHRVAAVYAGRLNVLDDAANDGPVRAAREVDVDFER